MSKRFKKIIRAFKYSTPHVGMVFALIITIILLSTNTSFAQTNEYLFNPMTLILDGLTNLIYSLQTVASWTIYLTGALLNFSINLTMNIKSFVTATDAVYTVWKAIRDISGMFIIFSLLYAAILLIISYEKPNLGNLIKNIVIAGVLINFSFFLTGLAIDASNIVSLQIYNAIVPQQKNKIFDKGLKDYIFTTSADAGLSTIFMQSMGLTRLYNPDGSMSSAGKTVANSSVSSQISKPFLILITGATSIIIMVTVALSFLVASLAFIVRFVILIFLLAFSPIWFASFVIPQLKEYSSKWTNQLKNQLLFMPVYLLLMYVALSVVTSSSIFRDGYVGSLSNGGGALADFMVLGVNAALLIIMLNAPLVAALSMGAIMPGFAKKIGADAIWKKVGGFTGGVAGRSTLGWAGAKIDKSLANSRIGNTLVGRDLRAATTGAMAKAKYGGSRSYEETVKEQKTVDAKAKEIKRRKQFDSIVNKKDWSRPDPDDSNELHIDTLLKTMNKSEKLALGAKTISENPEILTRMKSGDFDAIKEATEGYTDEDKRMVADARKKLLTDSAADGNNSRVKKLVENMSDEQWKSMKKDRVAAIKAAANGNHQDVVKTLMKEMDGKELKEVGDNPDPTIADLIVHPHVTDNLTPGQLKKMADEGLNSANKRAIANLILARPGHQAIPWITDRRNHNDWV